MTDVPDLIVGGRPPRFPFRVTRIPLIARLCRLGYHRYRNRWAKRLGKRPGRLAFDFAYHGLGLRGRGEFALALPEGDLRLSFDARQVQFRALYDADPGGYEPEVAAILETLLTGDAPFFDVGANWGYFALYAATIPGYRGPIHAFEPIAESFADLEGLVVEAGLRDRVTCHRIALSDADGEARMAYDPAQSGLARLGVEAPTMRDVRVARLDGLDLPPPGVIKLDVENHEFQALQGAEELLRGAGPNLVFESWISKNDRELTLAPLRFLEGLDYLLYRPEIRDGGRDAAIALERFRPEERFGFTDQINVFACRRDRVAAAATGFSAGDPKADLG